MKTERPLRISFVLPGAGRYPVGGFKVVYEYANHLSRRGHQVTVVHPALSQRGVDGSGRLRASLRFAFRAVAGNYTPAHWFQIDPVVKTVWVPSLAAEYIPDGDVVVASAWQTAEWVAAYPASKGKGFYLIQQLETWHGMDERVIATWKLPLRKFVIAHWLQDFARDLGVVSEYLPNGLDFQRFNLINPSEKRRNSAVMMLYHLAADKGSRDGLRALMLAHEQVPELTVTLFGTPKKPVGLPSWIEYHNCPEQELLCRLYNAASIFVAPSWTEGWALPPAEAMMCGASLVATDIGGHRGYAIDGETALLSPPKQPEQLACNIVRLIRDDELRIRLAKTSNAHIRQFTWQRSVDQMESALYTSDQEE